MLGSTNSRLPLSAHFTNAQAPPRCFFAHSLRRRHHATQRRSIHRPQLGERGTSLIGVAPVAWLATSGAVYARANRIKSAVARQRFAPGGQVLRQ